MISEEEIMTDIYNTLRQIRYPEITMAEPQNVEYTILTGENRISLLSWLLTEKSSQIATVLEKLQGTTLKDELLKYYSDIGICDKMDLLMGNCTLKEQLPTLRLLLDFMKSVHIERSEDIHSSKESIDSILQFYANESSNAFSLLSHVKPKVNYSTAMKYFKDMEKSAIDFEGSNTNLCPEDKVETGKGYCAQSDNREFSNSDPLTFGTEKKRFVEIFSAVGTWPMSSTSNTNATVYSMNDIKKIYSDFSALKEFLQAKDEISKAIIPKKVNKSTTLLSNIIEDTVILTQEVRNMRMYY